MDSETNKALSVIISVVGNYVAGTSGKQLWSICSCSCCLIPCKQYGEGVKKTYQSLLYEALSAIVQSLAKFNEELHNRCSYNYICLVTISTAMEKYVVTNTY